MNCDTLTLGAIVRIVVLTETTILLTKRYVITLCFTLY